jgi:DNA-binding ferritin-like protein
MFDTRNDLALSIRTQVVKRLNTRLAEAIDLRDPGEVCVNGAQVRAGIDAASRLGDADSSDLFTSLSREADRYRWFLQAHLHGKR